MKYVTEKITKDMLGYSYTPNEKERLLKYMKSFDAIAAAPESVYDVTDNHNTFLESKAYSDGLYCWETQDIYHLEKYDLALPKDFLRHVL